MEQQETHKNTGSLTLKRTTQLSIGGQTHTFEYIVQLQTTASQDEITGAITSASAGMSVMLQQIAQKTDHLNNSGGPAAHEPHPLPIAEKTPIAATVTETAKAPEKAASRFAPATMAAFLKAALEYGFRAQDIPAALQIPSLEKFTDFAGGLERLKLLVAEKTSDIPAAQPQKAPAHSFAEETSPYETGQEAEETVQDDEMDEPDFQLTDDVFDPETSQPGAPSSESDAARMLKSLRAISAKGMPASAELRQRLKQQVIDQLGSETAQQVVKVIWNPPAGERLNAARTQALIDWSAADNFIQTAHAVIQAETMSGERQL